jgi:uncharacterized protein
MTQMEMGRKSFETAKKALKDYGKLEKALERYLKGRPEVVLAYLFGSFVDRQGAKFSDIDIAVLVDEALMEKAEALGRYGYAPFLITEIAHLLKYPEIDLSLLNRASPLLQKRVISHGRLIYARSEKERIAFETSALSRYADTEPLRRIKRLYMQQRIQRGIDAYARPPID